MTLNFSNYNLILINLDGLRKDKVNLCPNLKSFKEKNIYFSKMITVSPYTLAAHHAIFSGLYPSENGVDAYYHMFRFKKDDICTLPEHLKNAGYYTRCDVISESIIPSKGFDLVTTFNEKTVNFKKHHSEIIKTISKHDKFFLFLHYEGLHSSLVEDVIKKYDPKSNEDEYFEKKQENEQRYNSYLPDCDEYVHSILKTLDDLAIADKTIIIFFSDHGTSIGERKGEKFYGVYVYDYTINTFCIIRPPSQSSRIIDTQCRIIDIFPTILDLLGVSTGSDCNKISAESLIPLIEDPDIGEREVFVETGGLYGYWPSPKKHNVFCIRKKNQKLIYNDTPETWEFYDLKSDPKELHNVYDEKSSDVERLKERLLFYLKKNKIDTKISPKII